MNQKGFTLIEIIAVLTILGILAAVGAVKFIKFDDSAARVVLRDAVVKLNAIERGHWANAKLSEYVGDEQIFDLVKADVMETHKWQSISPTGGVLKIREQTYQVERQPSMHNKYGIWKEVPNG